MGKTESSLASLRELVTRDPSAPAQNRLAIALGATVMTLVLFAPSAFRHDDSWRVLLALAAGSTSVAWVRVFFDLVGRRARMRRAYVRWLRALAPHEALIEVIAIHREMARDALHPEEARVRLEALVKTAEESGITDSIRRWESVKETLHLALDAEREALLEKSARAERERQMHERSLARRHDPPDGWLAVRHIRPRVKTRVSRHSPFSRSRPAPVACATQNPAAASARAAGVVSMASPPLMPLRETTRWAPFAQIGPLSKELFDLFGDPESLPPSLDEDERHASDAHGGAQDAPGVPRVVLMDDAVRTGHHAASRGVVIESVATGEWIAPRRKTLFAKMVSDAREVSPRGCVGETMLKGRG